MADNSTQNSKNEYRKPESKPVGIMRPGGNPMGMMGGY
jgi:hypothetical protein